MLDNTPNQPTKFRTKNWVEINDNAGGTYNINNQIKFKSSMLKWSLCDYNDAYILVSETRLVQNRTATGQPANNTGENVTFKNCAPITDCISEMSHL